MSHDHTGPEASGEGRALPPTSRYAGDDGTADPALAAALAAHASGTADLRAVVDALRVARVMVPVVARLEQAGEAHGLTVDKEASAGVVALRAPDGRTALPVFSSAASLSRWQADARPVPTEAPRAAASALQEGWELLVLDPAGPVTVVVAHPAVRALATGRPWLPAVTDGAVRADVQQAVAEALADVPHLRGAHAQAGRTAEVAVVLAVEPGLDRGGLDALLAAVDARLSARELLVDAVDSLELRVVAAR